MTSYARQARLLKAPPAFAPLCRTAAHYMGLVRELALQSEELHPTAPGE